jgi:cellulose synthase/poly-beta-1,6-N-acetylglucosamine synthase-like glycosyltransferase
MNEIVCILLFLLILTGINYCGLIFCFCFGWFKVKPYRNKDKQLNTKVSIILPFRNEEKGLLNCLEHLIKQNYPPSLFEIILIDDHSTDTSLEKAKNFKETHPVFDVKIIELKNIHQGPGSKKRAIREGIDTASGELIITTDADCTMGAEWIKTIVAFYEENKPKMIISPVCFVDKSSFFGKLQQLEFLSLQAITVAAAGIKHPIMANGANLAYQRQAFYDVQAFSGNEHIASGDDVFLLHQFQKKFPGEILFIKSLYALVYTDAPAGFDSFISQRKRWTSKNRHYKDLFTKYTGLSVFLFCFMLLISLCFSICSYYAMLFGLAFYFIKFLIDLPLLLMITSFLKKKRLMALYPIAGMLYPPYVVFMGIYGSFGKYEWKGRAINS